MKKSYRKYWKWIIRTICFFLIVLPISTIFDPGAEENKGEWVNRYVLNTFEYAAFYIPLITLLIFIPRIKNDLKRLLIASSLILSIIGSYVAFQSVAVPIQDFIPQIGMAITLFIFPITIVNSLIEWNEQKKINP